MRIIAGKYKGINITVNVPEGVRPTQDALRETIFNILYNYMEIEGARSLDLFAGTGALGLEALSRGASECVFVEKNPRVCGIIKSLLKKLPGQAPAANVVCREAVKFLSKYDAGANPFDLILADPPYEAPLHADILLQIAERNLLSPQGTIMLETKKNFSVIPPAGLMILDERTFGDSKVFFLKNK